MIDSTSDINAWWKSFDYPRIPRGKDDIFTFRLPAKRRKINQDELAQAHAVSGFPQRHTLDHAGTTGVRRTATTISWRTVILIPMEPALVMMTVIKMSLFAPLQLASDRRYPLEA